MVCGGRHRVSSTILGIIASGGAAAAGATSFESIATASGTGSSGTITFSAIPGTYKHLHIRGIARTTTAIDDDQDIYIRFNSDSGNNYATHAVRGTGGTVGTNELASTSSMFALRGARGNNSSSNTLGASMIDILDYASTSKNKTMRAFAGNEDNDTTGDVAISSGLWMSTSAITTIQLLTAADNWTTQTTFALYGIKEA